MTGRVARRRTQNGLKRLMCDAEAVFSPDFSLRRAAIDLAIDFLAH
jgi:hypothetical protein